MTDLTATAAALSSLKTAFDLTKSLLDVQGAAKIGAKVIELQSQILSAQQSAMNAQQEQATLIEAVKSLESEIARLKKWDADKSDYRLEDVGSGAFVYSPKREPTASEPNHWLCVKCFEGGQRSLVQNLGRRPDKAIAQFACPSCKNGFDLHWNAGPQRRGKDAA